ncbi:MAG: DUF721 domain-containing protein [Bacteroidales bacterium]|nr:DUF721 domain-containing protein [Bacteroidales bacterium]
MAYDSRKNGLRRQEAVGMEELVRQFIRDMRLTAGLDRQRVSDAWTVVSGAGRYTLDVNFDKGVMVCAISSSVVRNQLYFQRDSLLCRINEYLASDGLSDGEGDGIVVRTLILK